MRSLPVRGAWIEICRLLGTFRGGVSLPVRGAWIEISGAPMGRRRSASLPVRGAWIEIKLESLPDLFPKCRSP